jgi:quinol monooxygenase YgiN
VDGLAVRGAGSRENTYQEEVMENANAAVLSETELTAEPIAPPRARVLVFYRAPEDDPLAVERIYHEVSGEMQGTEGLIANELIKDLTDPGSYVVASEWLDMAAFAAWDKSSGHRRTTPLDPFQDADSSRRKLFGIYEVVARYT